MESINKYKNCKIENLQNYYGGNYSIHTGEQNTASQDREVYNDDGCLIKRINGAGFNNWIHGNRSVETYDGNCAGYTYTANVNVQID